MSAEQEYSLVVPFIPVASRGGPYDDTAYTAGYEMGLIDACLHVGAVHEAIIRTANTLQADLIAMRRGYVCQTSPVPGCPEWSHVRFIQADAAPL